MNTKLQVMIDFLTTSREKGFDFMTQVKPICDRAWSKKTPAEVKEFLDAELKKLTPVKEGVVCR
jgi:hypothetical protein